MAVHHRLPGSHTDSEPYFVGGRLEILLNHSFAFIDQSNNSVFLFNIPQFPLRC
jgi:hypothetical protein